MLTLKDGDEWSHLLQRFAPRETKLRDFVIQRLSPQKETKSGVAAA